MKMRKDSAEKRTKSCAKQKRAEKSIFIYENSFIVSVSALHRVSKVKFSFGAPKSVRIIQRPL